MRKYWAIFTLMIIKTMQYRSEILVWIMIDSLPFIILFFVWNAILTPGGSIKGYDVTGVINYYLLVFLITSVADSHFAEWRAEEVRLGKIDHYISKPFSYLHVIFWQQLSGKCFYLAIFLPCFGLLLGLAHYLFGTSFPWLTGSSLLFLAISLLLSFAFNFMLTLWIVLLAFWLDSAQGLTHFHSIATTVLSGAMIPLAFMPKWLATIVELLPFKYLYLVPIGVLQNTYQVNLWDALYMISVLCIMYFMTKKLWQKAVYTYTSAGG